MKSTIQDQGQQDWVIFGHRGISDPTYTAVAKIRASAAGPDQGHLAQASGL